MPDESTAQRLADVVVRLENYGFLSPVKSRQTSAPDVADLQRELAQLRDENMALRRRMEQAALRVDELVTKIDVAASESVISDFAEQLNCEVAA